MFSNGHQILGHQRPAKRMIEATSGKRPNPACNDAPALWLLRETWILFFFFYLARLSAVSGGIKQPQGAWDRKAGEIKKRKKAKTQSPKEEQQRH